MSTSSTSSTGFNGQSTFAADFKNVITRAVGIASLPITQLQNLQSSLTSQQGELQTLGSSFQSVQNALDALNTSTGFSSFAATVDTPAVATASIATGALAGTYAVNVTSIGSQTNTISAAGSTTVSDPSRGSISSSTSFTLSVGSGSYTIAPKDTSLNSLVQAINSSGANVQATVVNVGGSANPDYRLSVQGTQYSPDAIQLNDGTTNLLSTLSTGSYVKYQVNGQPTTPVNSTTRSLSISTGLTVNVLQTGTANVTVAQSSSSVSNALSSLATAYNAAVDALAKNRGQNGGALAGQSIVSQLSDTLRSLTNYSTTSGSVNGLVSLGLTFDQNGHLQFDQDTFNSKASSSLGDVLTFLGSESGGGFLKAASSAITSTVDSVTGSISEASQNIGESITKLTTKIAAKQDQITQLQTTLTAQMAAADSTISALQQQVTQITNLFSAMTQASKNITG